ncbi:MAG: hypothetical protein LBH59_11365, partial [Planctomycetaceae bacterium]|nr:hypothetical protein [Planctomycetaceae bacterium]
KRLFKGEAYRPYRLRYIFCLDARLCVQIFLNTNHTKRDLYITNFRVLRDSFVYFVLKKIVFNTVPLIFNWNLFVTIPRRVCFINLFEFEINCVPLSGQDKSNLCLER